MVLVYWDQVLGDRDRNYIEPDDSFTGISRGRNYIERNDSSTGIIRGRNYIEQNG